MRNRPAQADCLFGSREMCRRDACATICLGAIVVQASGLHISNVGMTMCNE